MKNNAAINLEAYRYQAESGKLSDEFFNAITRMRELEAEVDALKMELKSRALDYFRARDRVGDTKKTLVFKGRESFTTVTRRDQWRNMSPEHAELFKLILDRHYEGLFEESTVQKLDADFNALLAECERAGVNLHKYYRIVKVTKPSKGFTERLNHLRSQFTEAENQDLDALIESIRYDMQVVVK